MTDTNQMKAEVIAVFPDKVKISVDDIAAFAGGQSMKVGSYLQSRGGKPCSSSLGEKSRGSDCCGS